MRGYALHPCSDIRNSPTLCLIISGQPKQRRQIAVTLQRAQTGRGTIARLTTSSQPKPLFLVAGPPLLSAGLPTLTSRTLLTRVRLLWYAR